jgi:hypothetical protein
MLCRLFIHFALTYSVGPSSIVWSELGPAPCFPPTRVLEVAFSLVWEVAFTLGVQYWWGHSTRGLITCNVHYSIQIIRPHYCCVHPSPCAHSSRSSKRPERRTRGPPLSGRRKPSALFSHTHRGIHETRVPAVAIPAICFASQRAPRWFSSPTSYRSQPQAQERASPVVFSKQRSKGFRQRKTALWRWQQQLGMAAAAGGGWWAQLRGGSMCSPRPAIPFWESRRRSSLTRTLIRWMWEWYVRLSLFLAPFLSISYFCLKKEMR